jgi:hypothetical protein
MLAVGGHFSGVIFARIVFSLIISLVIFKIYKIFNLFFERYVFNEKLKKLPNLEEE